MKKGVCISIVLSLSFSLFAQSVSSNMLEVILSSYSTKMFVKDPIKESKVEAIMNCGLKAPSARNSQLWRFTIIHDVNLGKKVIPDMIDGNILILVSGLEERQMGVDVVFDCGLATENMYLAAQGLGLGAHIYTGPVENVNRNLRKELMVPEGFKVIAILRIGSKDKSIDSVSAASKRKEYKEVVNRVGK